MVTSYSRIALLALVGTLTACQSMNTASIKRIQDTPASKNNAQLYCTGTVSCEFERWNQIKIVDADNHRVSREAIREKVVRLKRDDLNEANALFLSVPAGQHELVIRFYPVSVDRAETLHVIHRFKPAVRYTFRMFRARSRHQGSLLNMSAPDPLCVDLKQNQRTIRRFCKPYNVLNGLGEFVEQKL